MAFVASLLSYLFFAAAFGVCGYLLYFSYRILREGRWGDRIALGVGLVLTGVLGLIPKSSEMQGSSPLVPRRIELYNEVIASSVLGMSVFVFLGVAVSCAVQKRPRFAVTALLWALVAGPLAACARWVQNPDPWTRHGRLVHPSGATYVFLDSSFLQGQRLVIARETAHSWEGTTYQGLVGTNGDSPRSWASVIRPAGREGTAYGQLHLAPDGRVIAIRSANQAYMAYDPARRAAFARRTIKALSPFVLLDADTEPSQTDVERCLEAIDAAKAQLSQGQLLDALERSGVPTRTELERGLSHENPRVRSIARRLLERMR